MIATSTYEQTAGVNQCKENDAEAVFIVVVQWPSVGWWQNGNMLSI